MVLNRSGSPTTAELSKITMLMSMHSIYVPYSRRALEPFRALYTLPDSMTMLAAAFRLRHECATFDRKAAMLFSLRLSNVTAICPPPLVQQVTCTLPACNSATDVTCTTNGFNTPRAYSWTHRSSADARAEIVPRRSGPAYLNASPSCCTAARTTVSLFLHVLAGMLQCVPVLLHCRQNHRFVIFHVPAGKPSLYLANATRPWLHPLSDIMVFRMAGANRSPADPASTAPHLAEDVYACHSLEHARARGQG